MILITICLALALTFAKEHPEAKLQFYEYCQHFNYPIQKHQVITEDGYILGVFRIQKKATTIRDGLKPILLLHGLMDSSDTFIVNEESKAPAFVLANAEYDVWLGNSRGNKHSRRHVSLNPDKDKQFWMFTFEEMGNLDMPAMFSYIYNHTQQKMHFLGHSQGTSVMHVSLSRRNPVVEELLDQYHAFGPLSFNSYQESKLMAHMQNSKILEWFKRLGVHEFLPSPGWFETDLGVAFCS